MQPDLNTQGHNTRPEHRYEHPPGHMAWLATQPSTSILLAMWPGWPHNLLFNSTYSHHTSLTADHITHHTLLISTYSHHTSHTADHITRHTLLISTYSHHTSHSADHITHHTLLISTYSHHTPLTADHITRHTLLISTYSHHTSLTPRLIPLAHGHTPPHTHACM